MLFHVTQNISDGNRFSSLKAKDILRITTTPALRLTSVRIVPNSGAGAQGGAFLENRPLIISPAYLKKTFARFSHTWTGRFGQRLTARLRHACLFAYRNQSTLRKRFLAVKRDNRTPSCVWVKHAAMRADAVASDESEAAKILRHLLCIQRLHANATARRVRWMRRRSFLR